MSASTITCYPIYVGRRATSLPTTFDVCYILMTGGTQPGTLYRRQCTQSNGHKTCNWVAVSTITSPYVFYDVCSELVCLVGFPGICPTTACPSGACPTFPNGTSGAAAATYGAPAYGGVPTSNVSGFAPSTSYSNTNPAYTTSKIGRASCRERV